MRGVGLVRAVHQPGYDEVDGDGVVDADDDR